MKISDADKHFLFSILFAGGVILFWRGIWGIADVTPIVENVFVSFFLGLLILTLTGLIYREFDPLEQKLARISGLIEHIANDPNKHDYEVEYWDEILKKNVKVNGEHIREKEFGYFIIKKEGREFFIPVRRVSTVIHKGRIEWKK